MANWQKKGKEQKPAIRIKTIADVVKAYKRLDDLMEADIPINRAIEEYTGLKIIKKKVEA